ncbi:MAG: tetratricopeptide repeat protein, partial [Candidatus Binatia bacterium]
MRFLKGYFSRCLSLLLIPAALFGAEAQIAFNEGVKQYKSAKYKEAVAAFNRAIKAAPKSDEAYNNRGLAYAKLGQQDNALKDYDEALKLNPNLTDAQFNRGNVF